MSKYKKLFENNPKTADKEYLDKQSEYERIRIVIMYSSLFGSFILFGIAYALFGRDTAYFCGGVSVVWYLLGYNYCSTLWEKEKDAKEYIRALNEHEYSPTVVPDI